MPFVLSSIVFKLEPTSVSLYVLPPLLAVTSSAVTSPPSKVTSLNVFSVISLPLIVPSALIQPVVLILPRLSSV